MIGLFWVHTVTVETFLGTSAYDETFAEPVSVTGFLNDVSVFTKTASNQEVTAPAVFFTDTSNAALFAEKSRLTFNGSTARVVKVNTNDSGGLGLPDHVEVQLA